MRRCAYETESPVRAQVEGVGEVYSHARRPFAQAPESSPDAAGAGGHERCTERRARHEGAGDDPGAEWWVPPGIRRREGCARHCRDQWKVHTRVNGASGAGRWDVLTS
jgi:hypothetical protein